MVVVLLKQLSVASSDCGCNVGRTESSSRYANSELDELEGSCSIEKRDSSCNTKFNEMVLIPGGKYQFGIDEVVIESDNEGPKRIVDVAKFQLDKYEVSNIAYQEFVEATNYKTEAEEFGDSFVFHLFLNSTRKEELKDYRAVQAPWWYKVTGANWRHPHGPDSDIKGTISTLLCLLSEELARASEFTKLRSFHYKIR